MDRPRRGLTVGCQIDSLSEFQKALFVFWSLWPLAISQQPPLSAWSAREGLHLSEVVRGGGVDDVGLHEEGGVVVGPQVPIGGQHLVAAHRGNLGSNVTLAAGPIMALKSANYNVHRRRGARGGKRIVWGEVVWEQQQHGCCHLGSPRRTEPKPLYPAAGSHSSYSPWPGLSGMRNFIPVRYGTVFFQNPGIPVLFGTV